MLRRVYDTTFIVNLRIHIERNMPLAHSIIVQSLLSSHALAGVRATYVMRAEKKIEIYSLMYSGDIVRSQLDMLNRPMMRSN